MLSTNDTIRRGISLALQNVTHEDDSEPAPPAVVAEKLRPDGLRPLPPWRSKDADEMAQEPKHLNGVGVGLLAAFNESRTDFSIQDGQRNYEERSQAAFESLAEEMCFVCDWFKEEWPLENKDRTASCGYVGSLPLKVEVDFPSGPPQKEHVLVFADRSGICRRILEHAPPGRVASIEYVEQPPWAVTPEDIKQHLSKQKWDMVIYGGGLDFAQSNTVEAVMSHLDDITKLYLEVVKGCQSVRKCTKRLACLTREVFAEDASKHKKVGVRLATASTLWGMSNCMRVELEDLPLLYMDIELKPSESCLASIASELFCLETFGQNSVRLLNNGRYVFRTLESRKYQARKQEFELPTRGIIAVTGGNGSLAQVFCKHVLDLAERQQEENPEDGPLCLELRLLSRSAVVRDREARAWAAVVEKAAKLGVHVEHVKCDVTQQDSVTRFVQDCSPNLVGVIHTAGVLQDAMLPGQTWEKFEATLGCKARAALYFHDALEHHLNPNLEFFWSFSTNSVYGNAGQTNYAGSNFYLDGLMRHRVATGKPGVAMQWGAWGEAGMAAAMDERMKQGIAMSHMPFFSNEEGFRGMYDGLRTAIPSICIQKFNPQMLMGMKAQADNSFQRYDRNFTCEIVPTPPPSSKKIKSKDLYDVYRMYRALIGACGQELTKSGLVYKAHTLPAATASVDDDEPLW
mmetsp:Transcript_47602/g.101870  ORF Transcript_47602/g.101870 Transcript_47602/m.101870 type:complete len:686 (+) Transcript_47602:87-2144(+)